LIIEALLALGGSFARAEGTNTGEDNTRPATPSVASSTATVSAEADVACVRALPSSAPHARTQKRPAPPLAPTSSLRVMSTSCSSRKRTWPQQKQRPAPDHPPVPPPTMASASARILASLNPRSSASVGASNPADSAADSPALRAALTAREAAAETSSDTDNSRRCECSRMSSAVSVLPQASAASAAVCPAAFFRNASAANDVDVSTDGSRVQRCVTVGVRSIWVSAEYQQPSRKMCHVAPRCNHKKCPWGRGKAW
jgi:hypothetical protein